MLCRRNCTMLCLTFCEMAFVHYALGNVNYLVLKAIKIYIKKGVYKSFSFKQIPKNKCILGTLTSIETLDPTNRT